MNSIPIPVDLDACPFNFQSKPRFDAVVAYESFDLGLSAKAIYDNIRRRLPAECESELKLWSFDVLQIARLCKTAAREAALADLVLIATRERDQWPLGVESWLELWQWKPAGKSSALIGVVAKDSTQIGASSAILMRLQAIAARTGRDFFYQSFHLPGVRVEPNLARPATVPVAMPAEERSRFSPVTGFAGRGMNQ